MSGAPAAGREPVRVVLAGGRGHGHWHLDNLRRLAARGIVRLAGVCDVQPLEAAALTRLGRPEQGADLGELIERTGAGVVVVCTPIHTHTDLALTAASRGADVLLEKPPAPSLAEYRRLAAGLAGTGRACQIGFQSLGSHAVTAVRALIEDGAVGELRGIGAAGNWVREEHYFTRAAWSGRRRLAGRDVVDGVLTNPLAHAVATALRLDGSSREQDVDSIRTELFRAHDIESDDTSCVRVRTARGTRIVVAATLCAAAAAEPYVVVHGSRGRITLWYKQDRVLLQRAGHGPEERVHCRTDLLENLLAHRAGGAGLLVPPQETGALMRVVEAVRTAGDPRPVPGSLWHTVAGERSHRRVVDGVDGLVDAAAERLATFAELGAPWAGAARRKAAHR
ncbi:Gfo/Idh/MocA family protein [Actinacidiphila paucisporea]|uniref:Predicted dehydrogenase n=1 Tax=Actinacidiphila paucisporea TaxID=310782 RepID=A0A1M7NEU4_9ACTN|nr:Gfo/Idh/MocA family oxidoreductase [Actinacidiphila paucisporea]SHN02181.1 Predicted dehydrogenase [Actinacidiphila paucisporea]